MQPPKSKELRDGFRSAASIAVGYLPVAIGFGVFGSSAGLSGWETVLMSSTHFAGASQFLGVELMKSHAAVIEILLAILILNSRYFVMNLSAFSGPCRSFDRKSKFVIAAFQTDETLSFLSSRNTVSLTYLAALSFGAYAAWVAGTAVGAFAGTMFPKSAGKLASLICYSIFLSSLVPMTKRSKTYATAAGITAIVAAFLYLPPFSFLSKGVRLSLVILIGALLSTGFLSQRKSI